MPDPNPMKLLVVRAGRAGDLVMITPALRMILDAFPRAEVHVLTTGEGQRVLRGFDPRVTRFHLHHRRFPEDLLSQPRLERELRAEGYERVYVFESNPHYRKLVAGAAPHVHELGARRDGEVVHYCVRCLDLVAGTLDASSSPLARGWITLPVTAEGRAAAEGYLAAQGIPGASPGAAGGSPILVGLHPRLRDARVGWLANRDAKHREWPLASFARLARGLAERGRALGIPLRVVVDLLPEEKTRAAGLIEEAGDALTVLSGTPDFERYKALLQRFDLLVTPNTGPMHVAAAVGTPVVALFSRWLPEECGPFVPKDRYAILRAEETAEPERGLAAVPPEAVLERSVPFLTRRLSSATR